MAVRRACMKTNPSHRNAPVGVSVAAPAVQTPGTSVSPLTEPTGEDSSTLRTPSQGGDGVVQPRPKPRQTRRTAGAMQKWRVNKFDANAHKKALRGSDEEADGCIGFGLYRRRMGKPPEVKG
jgi:hypothetical protein